MSSERELFGGAITAVLPSDLQDASDLRQIPDTQEVFLYKDSSVSIIIEILEPVPPADNQEAIKFHFDSLAHDNSATSSTILSITAEPDNANQPLLSLTGTQDVPKFNRTQADKVWVAMGLLRVNSHGKKADVVITMNVPVSSTDGGAVGVEGVEAAKLTFATLIASLRIVDYELFA